MAWHDRLNSTASFETTEAQRTFLTQAEAAKMLRISPRSIERWRVSGQERLPFVKLGRRVVYRLSDLLDYAATRTVLSTSELDRDAHR